MVGTCRARRTRRVWVPSVCMVCYPSSPRARDAHGAPLHYGYTYYARRTLAVRAHAGASALPDRSLAASICRLAACIVGHCGGLLSTAPRRGGAPIHAGAHAGQGIRTRSCSCFGGEAARRGVAIGRTREAAHAIAQASARPVHGAR